MKHFAGLFCALLTALFLYAFPDQSGTLAAGRLEATRPASEAHRIIPHGQDGGRAPATAHGRTIAGYATVIDGDTIELDGERIRLEGIDAPEIGQSCTRTDGRSWPAGKVAATTLQRSLRGRRIVCEAIGRDSYDRTLGRCSAGGQDINAAMIHSGLAWAFVKYSSEFVAEEAAARRSAKGVWAYDCQTAWDFRAGRWQVGAQSAPNGCAIKGNITSRGRIYHMPWNAWYGRTRVEPAKGERWFCDERQALAAGWRPARTR